MTETAWQPFGLDPSRLFINGVWQSAAAGHLIDLQDPSSGDLLCGIARGEAIDIDRAVAAARRAATGAWGSSTAVERGRLLHKLGARILEEAEHLAALEAIDVGKPLSQARADVIALARYCEFYAGAADKVHGETLPYLDGYTVYTLREPHGVTGHIVPWNYPMQVIGRSVCAALAMGNATVLKPAEEACLSALAFAELSRQVGFPDGVINVVPGLGGEAGAALSGHPGVQHVSFTGSPDTGKAVQQAAARHVAPVTLELGGKCAQLVFDDADLDAALPFLLSGGMQNAGQTCSASSRLLVQRGVYGEVVERLIAAYRNLRVGPALSDLDVGPVISSRQRTIVHGFLEQAADLETLATGTIDESAPDDGFYCVPTLFGNVPPRHALAQQEIFGPVQVVIPFEDEDDALAIANGTPYGLVAAVWTRDGGRQFRLARALRAGQVFINSYGDAGDAELPFGGVGKSGHGREKGFEALYGFSTLKTVAVQHG